MNPWLAAFGIAALLEVVRQTSKPKRKTVPSAAARRAAATSIGSACAAAMVPTVQIATPCGSAAPGQPIQPLRIVNGVVVTCGPNGTYLRSVCPPGTSLWRDGWCAPTAVGGTPCFAQGVYKRSTTPDVLNKIGNVFKAASQVASGQSGLCNLPLVGSAVCDSLADAAGNVFKAGPGSSDGFTSGQSIGSL